MKLGCPGLCCAHCSAAGGGHYWGRVALRRCSSCHAAYYCGRDCQRAHYDAHKRLFISYDEVWPNGTVDSLKARVKSNAKFQCESTGGYEQKATNEAANLPDDPEDRVGENAKPGIKKYYLRDKDAAED